VIYARDGAGKTPLVLNEMRYTLFADPKFITKHAEVAKQLSQVTGAKMSQYEELLKADSRYVVLAKKLDKETKEEIEKLDLLGVGLREAPQRAYPQEGLAAQVLGFVNDAGDGKYGIEQYLHESLKGSSGQLRAITDANGVPLVGNDDNVLTEPKKGTDVTLTIDIGMQRQLEEKLKSGLMNAQSKSGSALILEAKTGAIKAMANYPSYKPAEFYKQKDITAFTNPAISSPYEVGSVMKPLTLAAALDQGVVNRNTTYYDPGYIKLDDATITNVQEVAGSGTRTMPDILRQSLNTGATWLLMQMGGGEVNEQARKNWYEYMTKKYRFGSMSGVEQGYESGGSVPHPTDGFGLNIQYANTSFGQGMTATPLQMASALATIVNGGTYYKPYLVDSLTNASGVVETTQPKIVQSQAIKKSSSATIKSIMEDVFKQNYPLYGMKTLRKEYSVGGKSGTPEITKPGGGYYENKFNGSFMGFVGGDEPQYVIYVRVNEPGIPGYAGAKAAAPIFVDLTEMLLDNFGVTPKSS